MRKKEKKTRHPPISSSDALSLSSPPLTLFLFFLFFFSLPLSLSLSLFSFHFPLSVSPPFLYPLPMTPPKNTPTAGRQEKKRKKRPEVPHAAGVEDVEAHCDPAGHREQAVASAESLYSAGLLEEQATSPPVGSGHSLPAVQLVQLVAPALENWPGGQGSGGEVVSAQKCPAGQVVHVSCPSREYSVAGGRVNRDLHV